jgi:hypothetical protein
VGGGETDVWVAVFLGIIALGSLVQVAVLARVLVAGRRLYGHVREVQDRYDREIRPMVETVTRVSRNVAEISDLAALQARRVDAFMADTAQRVDEVTDVVRGALHRSVAPLVDVSAFLRGLRRGIETYQRLGGLEAQGRGRGRRYAEEDEHLFI